MRNTIVTPYKLCLLVLCIVLGAAGADRLQAQSPSLQLTATNSDGTNTGTARLGTTTTMTAAVTGTTSTAVTWSVQGAGSISSSGVYTAPNLMPSNSAVTITAALQSQPSVTASYNLALGNPIPRIGANGVSPSQLLTGATQTVTISGSGFIPGTVVVMSGAQPSVTYVNYNQITAQIPVSATASGSISFQVENPAPQGGHGTIATVTIPANSISLTAVDQDGTNTGTAELGINVAFSATVKGSAQTAVNWSVQGAGSISASGVYTAPAAMPSSNAVVVTASLASNPAITASYQFTLINPAPVLSAASVSQLAAGATTPVTVSGANFVPGTVVMANGAAVPTTYQSASSLVAQVSLPSSASGNVSLQAQTPAPGGGASSVLSLPVAVSLSVTATDQDGTNTGTAELGINVNFAASVVGSSQTAVNWSVQGAGSITASGVYTAPASMPSSPVVIVTATLASNSSVTASYQFNLINPVPVLSSANVTQLTPGATSSVTFSGSNFVSGTVLLVNGTSVTASYQSPSSISAQITLPASATGNVSIQAQSPAPGGGTSATLSIPVAISINLTATSSDGTNTGTARLGGTVTMSASVLGSTQTAVNWSVQGAGSISSSGVYSGPTSMPSSSSVVITATLASNSSVTATYSLSLVNPIPRTSSSAVSPAQLTAGSTQTLTISGSGFVPGTIAIVNGTGIATNYTDFNDLTVAVPVPASAAGTSLSIQLQNPAPGGGYGTMVQEPVSAGALTLTAVDGDGTNTGTAELGVNVTMSATATGTSQTAVTWSVQGAGSISAAGIYTAPSTMPSSAAVTITAALTSNPSVTASYSLTLINPAPAIATTSPTEVLVGGTTTLTITGSQFVPGVAVLVNGTAASTTYVSPTSVTVSVVVPSGATGSVSIQAQNPSPSGGPSSTIQVPIQKATLTLSASNVNGTNSGTDPLFYTTTFTKTVTGTSNTAVTWSVAGAGSISSSGVYTPPTTMPSNPVVTVTATLNQYSSVTASYTFSLVNPVAGKVNSISPTKLAPGQTNNLTVYGTNFVPGVTVLVNGSPVATTYVSATQVTISIPVAGTATGSIPIAAQNPAPGGGIGTAFQEPIGVESITLYPTTSDGNSTGYVRIGQGMSINTSVQAVGSSLLNWTLTGPGSFTTSGSTASAIWYTIGDTWPSTTTATITASLASNPAITASYTFSIVNAIPTLSQVWPASWNSDQTNSISVVGLGFTQASTIYVNGVAIPTTFVSYAHMNGTVFLPDNTVGPVSVQVINGAPGGGVSAIIQQPVTLKVVQVTGINGVVLNPTTAVLGTSIQFADRITSGPGDPTATWSVQGGGTVTSAGLYQAPSTMPSSGSSVSVIASLVTNPAAQGTYPLTLIYPQPLITQTSPTMVASGATTNVTIQGTGFTPATTLTASGSTISVNYVSPTTLTAQIVTTSGQTGTIPVVASNPTTGGGGGAGNTFKLQIGSPATASAQITVQPGNQIPANFLGFSHEWNGLTWMLGSTETEYNLPYRQLIKNLMLGQNYPFFIRIGGNSTDTTTSVQDMTAEQELAKQMNVQFTFGLNLGGTTTPTLATQMAQAYSQAMPANSLVAFELGNEPDAYDSNGDRSSNYATTTSIAPFLNDYATWSCSIYSVAPTIPFMGPSWGTVNFGPKMDAIFDVQESPLAQPVHPAGCSSGQFEPVSIISSHVYGGFQTTGVTFAPDYLLSAQAVIGPSEIAPVVKTAHQNGQLFRIGEINSIDGGGVNGVSNTFSSALWAMDVMFGYASVGADGVNWHGMSNCYYCLFNFDNFYTGGQNIYSLQSVGPIYYGLLMFQEAASNGAQLLPVSLNTSANLKVWATQDNSGTVHVLIINKDETFSGNVAISLPGYGTAQEIELLAPSYQSQNGITLGGQTFDGTTDGTIQGTAVPESITPGNGTYTVPVEPTSAVLLNMQPAS